MKHLILLLFFGLGSCHIHYHIEPKNEQPKSGIILTDQKTLEYKSKYRLLFSDDWCGVIGCAVYHGKNLGSDWGDFMGKYPKDSINPNIRSVHAATPLSQEQKNFFNKINSNQ